jgi:tetratricopeptide (TPR) repeat protein
LWKPDWLRLLVPGTLLAAGALIGGMAITYLFAGRYRAALFYQTSTTSTVDPRALEAAQAAGLLIFVYGFVFLTLLALATALAWPALTERKRSNRSDLLSFAAIAAIVLFPLALLLLVQTNMRSVQADMVFKRGRPFDDQATRTGQADPAIARQAWDAAIGLYDGALERLPSEDFYYLFLGRALLERSGLTEDATEKAALLQEAEERLLEARILNPLNTDHTANLARLNTRWYGAIDDEAERSRRLEEAERYYREALALSPQNSIVRNEYARLALEVRRDCDRALALYDESASIDPFYIQTFLVRADAYVLCGSSLAEPARTDHFASAAESLEQALALDPSLTRAWVQLAEVYRQQGANEAALDAVGSARETNDDLRFPTGELDFIEARIRAAQGDLAAARALAEGALPIVGPETVTQIEEFLSTLGTD